MRWLLDSNVWIDAVAKKPTARHALVTAFQATWCGYSAVTRLEILSFQSLTVLEIADWRLLLANAEEVPVSDAVIEEAARLRRSMRIKTPDAIIAASALLENATLITRNIGDFQKVQGLAVVEPAKI